MKNLSVIIASLDDTSPDRRGVGSPVRFPENANRLHRKRHLFANGSHFGGAGASAPERASPVKLLQRRCDTMALTSRVRIAVCLALWQHPCPLRLLRRHLSQSERLWHSVTFFSKRKSVSSKTRPLCQGLPCQGSCRAEARLRGWTKDAFRVSGITQVLLCTTSPSSSLTLDATSPSRGGFGSPVRFLSNFNQSQQNDTSLPRAPLVGKTPPAGGGGTQVPKGERLSSGCETERFIHYIYSVPVPACRP